MICKTNTSVCVCGKDNPCKVSVKLEENDQEGMMEETKRKAVEAWNKRVGEVAE